MKKAKKAGVLGVICIWDNLTTGNAAGQYLPFTNGYRDCPALWVDSETGERLMRGTARQAKVRLVLQAELTEGAESDTLYAVLPGTSRNESIVINTHTDGPNAWEENGGVGLLAIAEYFSKIPQEQRRRDLIFVLVTGHFQLPQFGIQGQATTRWLHDHPELWDGKGTHQKAVAGITVEHLGCTEWKEDHESGAHQATGGIEMEYVYAGNEQMNQIYLSTMEGRKRVRSILLKPKSNIYFGEGQPLFNAGIPTLSLIPGPDYLCAIGDDDLKKIDALLMIEQIATFTQAVATIDAMETEQLRENEPQAKGILGLLVKEEHD